MVRQVLIASALVLSATALTTAQQKARGGAPPPATKRQTPAPQRPAAAPPAPPQSVPPPVLLPMAPLALPPAGGLTAPVPFRPGSSQPPNGVHSGRRDPNRVHPGFPILPGYGYGYGYGGGYSYSEPVSTAPATDTAPPAVAGGLRLSGTPSEAQVLIDGYFVGTLGDIESGRPLTIPAGPHRLEVRATGYQPIAVDIQIPAYDTLTYRASLDRVPQSPAPRTPAAASSSPMYLIPNCYLGNVPPRQNRLPSGCDIKQVQVLGSK